MNTLPEPTIAPKTKTNQAFPHQPVFTNFKVSKVSKVAEIHSG